jgi:hypothetical protein
MVPRVWTRRWGHILDAVGAIILYSPPPFPVNVQWGLNNFPGEKYFFGERRLQKQAATSKSQNSSPFGLTVLLISLQITLSAQPTTIRPSEGS